jgi:hypothetical protein
MRTSSRRPLSYFWLRRTYLTKSGVSNYILLFHDNIDIRRLNVKIKSLPLGGQHQKDQRELYWGRNVPQTQFSKTVFSTCCKTVSAKCRSHALCSGSSRSRNRCCILQLCGGNTAFSRLWGFPHPNRQQAPPLGLLLLPHPIRPSSASSLLLRALASSYTAHAPPHPRH